MNKMKESWNRAYQENNSPCYKRFVFWSHFKKICEHTDVKTVEKKTMFLHNPPPTKAVSLYEPVKRTITLKQTNPFNKVEHIKKKLQ